MKNTRLVAAGAGLALGLAVAIPAAQATDMRAPEGPIEITVGSGAGGSPDVIMRTIAKIMNDEGIVENPIVVQNRTGGGHANAFNHVLSLPGNENTLLTLASPVFTTPIVQGLPSVIDQVTPIAGFIQSELVLLTTPDSPFNSLDDVVKAAKEQPGRIRVAGGSSGGNDHLVTALLMDTADIELTYIPHESGSAARATFYGGNVELHWGTLQEGAEAIEAGNAKALAILSEERRPEEVYTDVATAREQGYDIVYLQFWGIAGPPELDPAIAAWWGDKFEKATQSEAWQSKLKADMQLGNLYTLDDAGKSFSDGQAQFRQLLTSVGLAKN